jgi:hypothetical protein
MNFDPFNHALKIRESIKTQTPKVGVHLGVWGFIPSYSPTLMGAWNVTPGLHSWLTPSQALAFVTSPRLGLQHWSSMWLWHGMPFGNKLSQFSWQSMTFCDTINFCVFWIYGTNICHCMPFNFLCAMRFSKLCVCVLNNQMLTYNYDYNINSHFEKGDT